MKYARLPILLLLVVTLFTCPAHAQVITTFAGTGTPGYSGDGGPASAAKLFDVFNIKFDTSGNLYFCDFGNNAVRKIDTTGIITTIAGTGSPGILGDSGLATAAQLNAPVDLALDPYGNIFIADQFNARIRKVSTAGIITTFATGLSPQSLTTDVFGNLYAGIASNIIKG